MITAEIAGYTYCDEKLCPDCVRDWALIRLGNEGYRSPVDISTWTTEGLLNALALLWDVDREYADPEDFPVPFSGSQAESDWYRAEYDGDPRPSCAGEHCGNDFLGEF